MASSQLIQGEGAAVGPHRDRLAGRARLVDTVECLRVGSGIAVDEGIVELLLHRLRLELDHCGLQVLEVAAGGPQEVVHVGITAQDLEGGRDLGEGRRGLRPSVAHFIECGSGSGILPVVGEAVAHNLDEGERLEDGTVIDHRLDNSGEQDIVGELGGLRKG